MTIGLTYSEVRALNPCSDRFDSVSRLLGGKSGWNDRKVDAAAAREAGCTFDDIIWVASALAREDADVERRLRLWLADCVARVLHIYEQTETSDAAREVIIAARQFARGEISDAAWDAAKAVASTSVRTAPSTIMWIVAWATSKAVGWDVASITAWITARTTAWIAT